MVGNLPVAVPFALKEWEKETRWTSPHRPSHWEMRSGPAATTWPGRWGDGWGIAGVDHGLPSKIMGFHRISWDFNGISMGFQWDNMGHMMAYPPVKEHDHEETCSEK